MDTASISSSERSGSPQPDPVFLAETAAHSIISTPTTSVASSGQSKKGLFTHDPHVFTQQPASAAPSLPPSLLPSPSTRPQLQSPTRHGPAHGSHGTRRKRRPPLDERGQPRTTQAHSIPPGHDRAAHDISNSARSAAQLLQARWELKAQQQSESQARADAEARLSAGGSAATPSGRAGAGCTPHSKRHRRHRSQQSSESFFSAQGSVSPRRTGRVSASDPRRSSRASLAGPAVEGSASASIRSCQSSASARSSFHSARSLADAGTAALYSDCDTISEAHHAAHATSASPLRHRRQRTASSPSSIRSDRVESYLWDVPPDNTSRSWRAAPCRISAAEIHSVWGDLLAVSAPNSNGRARSLSSAPDSGPSGSVSVSVSESGSGSVRNARFDRRPLRRRSSRSSLPATKPPSAPGDRLGLGDLTSLRALDMGHRQLSHVSSVARTLTRPLSAPLKPVFQFWLAACLSTMTLISLSMLMACSYFLTFYDDAAHGSRSFTSAAAKATSRAPTAGTVLRRLAWALSAPIRWPFRAISHARPCKTSAPPCADSDPHQDRDDVGGPDSADPTSMGPPGPRPPLGPLLASLALTLAVAVGTGLFHLFMSYRERMFNQYFESDLDDSHASECEPDICPPPSRNSQDGCDSRCSDATLYPDHNTGLRPAQTHRRAAPMR